MADEEEGGEKPFEPSPRKLQEARKRGEVPISQDLVTFSAYSGILLAAFLLGPWSVDTAGGALRVFLDTPDRLARTAFDLEGRHGYAALAGRIGFAAVAWLVLPFAMALLAAFVQGALVFAPEKLSPRLSRISPIANAKQKFGREGLFNFVKSLAKLVLYSLVLFLVFRSRLADVLNLPHLPAGAGFALIVDLCLRFLVVATVTILVLSSIDLLWQRAQFFRRQRMTLQELKEETKESEGDPHTKQARRQRGYEIATNRMLADVPKADVVVVNPDHYAVALRWSRARRSAPVCVAKGVDAVAERIRDTASQHGVPLYRDPPTARALFAVVDLGAEIPAEHYRAIAAAIRFADAMRAKARERGRW